MQVTGGARIGVYDEHEIFRLGVLACLREDAAFTLVSSSGPAPRIDADGPLDLVVTSLHVAGRVDFGCGVLVCVPDPRLPPLGLRNPVRGVLPRSTLTAPQLLAAVRAAIAGLSVGLGVADGDAGHRLDARRCEVLRMLADGASTAEISRRLHCSERTVKALITDLKRHLHARTRAQVVAAGIRQGVI